MKNSGNLQQQRPQSAWGKFQILLTVRAFVYVCVSLNLLG